MSRKPRIMAPVALAAVVAAGMIMMLAVTGCKQNAGQTVATTETTRSRTASENAEAAPDEKLKAIVAGSNKLPAMVEFGADWCPPCRQMKPIVESLKKEYDGKVDIVYIDTDQYKDIARDYKISAIPVQLFFDTDGNQVFRHVGFFPEEKIKLQFSDLGVD